MKILVTGASGFIGTELINHLSNKKFNIFGISNTINSNNITKIPLNDLKKLNQFMSKNNFDIVIHLASMIQNDTPLKMYNSNCKTLINLLELCVNQKIKKFIFSSSHAVYGKTNYLPIDELHQTNPVTTYGNTKLICEQILQMYSNFYDIEIINLRFGSIYGENQSKSTFISKLISSALDNKKINLDEYKNGFQIMDLLHVKDACKAIELSCNSNISSNTYNIASGNPVTINEIADNVSKITKKNFYKIKKSKLETNHFFYDISKSKKDLKFIPKYRINNETLSTIIKNYQK